MKHPVTKYAIAAVVILAAVVGFSLLRRTSNTAWALEDSIQELSRYNGLLIEGMDSERSWIEGGSTDMRPSTVWAAADKNQTRIEKARIEIEGVRVLVTNGAKTWRYDPPTNTVRVENKPYVAAECWLGTHFFEQLNSGHGSGAFTRCETTYGRDPVTGAARLFLTCAWSDRRFNGPRSVCIGIDPDTKLPVSLKQWENVDCEGAPTFIADKITYFDKLPDELFDFHIPPGATVIEP